MEALANSINLENWMIVTSFLMVPLLDFLMRIDWDSRIKSVVAFISCMVVVAGKLLFDDVPDNFTDFVSTGLLLFALTIPQYYGFWKPTGISTSLKKNVFGGKKTRYNTEVKSRGD